MIDDLPDIADSPLGAGDIELAVEVHDSLVSAPDPVTQVKRRRSRRIAPCCHGNVPDGSFLSKLCEHPGFHSSVTHAAAARSQAVPPPIRPLTGAVSVSCYYPSGSPKRFRAMACGLMGRAPRDRPMISRDGWGPLIP